MNKSSLNKNITTQIKEFEVNEKGWEYQTKAKTFYLWFDRFNQKFFQKQLLLCLLSFEQTNRKTLGHYVLDRNGIGVKDNINLNSIHLSRRNLWESLATLLHEMAHQWQENYGKVNKGDYHNKEFIQKMEGFGLSYNSKGQRIAMPKGEFVSFLKKYKIEIKKEDVTLSLPTFPSKSKLKKYSCQCQPPINIRVANSLFSAKCNICGEDFELAE